MAPLVEAFHPGRLQQHIQYHADGRLRKPPVDLNQCPLKEMLQYKCELDGPKEDPKSKVVCEAFLRLFRTCADGSTVETTSWEGIHDGGMK